MRKRIQLSLAIFRTGRWYAIQGQANEGELEGRTPEFESGEPNI